MPTRRPSVCRHRSDDSSKTQHTKYFKHVNPRLGEAELLCDLAARSTRVAPERDHAPLVLGKHINCLREPLAQLIQ